MTNPAIKWTPFRRVTPNRIVRVAPFFTGDGHYGEVWAVDVSGSDGAPAVGLISDYGDHELDLQIRPDGRIHIISCSYVTVDDWSEVAELTECARVCVEMVRAL